MGLLGKLVGFLPSGWLKWATVIVIAALVVACAVLYGLWRGAQADVEVLEATVANQEQVITNQSSSLEQAFVVFDAKDAHLDASLAACQKRIQGALRDQEIFLHATDEVPAEPGKVVDDETSTAVLRELDALLPR